MFKKLKGLFILEEEGSAKDGNAAEATDMPEPKVPVQQTSKPAAGEDIVVDMEHLSEPKSGKPDDKFVDILLKAVEKANLKGFDYLEYKSSLQSLANMDMDEATKYKSALAMAQTMGTTPASLIKTANHYLSILKQEHLKFKEALKNQRTKQVAGREQEVMATQAQIEAKKKQILQLQKEIEADANTVTKLKDSINKAATKVQSTSDNFNYAYNVVTGQIQQDIDKMKKYLG